MLSDSEGRAWFGRIRERILACAGTRVKTGQGGGGSADPTASKKGKGNEVGPRENPNEKMAGHEGIRCTKNRKRREIVRVGKVFGDTKSGLRILRKSSTLRSQRAHFEKKRRKMSL